MQLFFVEMYGYESYLRVQYRLTLLHATELRVIGHVNTDTSLSPLDFKSTINLPEEVKRSKILYAS